MILTVLILLDSVESCPQHMVMYRPSTLSLRTEQMLGKARTTFNVSYFPPAFTQHQLT